VGEELYSWDGSTFALEFDLCNNQCASRPKSRHVQADGLALWGLGLAGRTHTLHSMYRLRAWGKQLAYSQLTAGSVDWIDVGHRLVMAQPDTQSSLGAGLLAIDTTQASVSPVRHIPIVSCIGMATLAESSIFLLGAVERDTGINGNEVDFSSSYTVVATPSPTPAWQHPFTTVSPIPSSPPSPSP
jgi:hypothetical protein